MTANCDQYAAGRGGVSGEIVVVGDGIIGLSIAVEAARRGGNVTVLGRTQQGAATWASGGLLAPSTGPLAAAVAPFFYGSLEAYGGFVSALRDYEPHLALISGLIELTPPEARDDGSSGATAPVSPARPLDAETLATLEPSLAWRAGMVLHEQDGAVDSRLLLVALRAAAAASSRIRLDRATEIIAVDLHATPPIAIAQDGRRFEADQLVIAAGAWAAQLGGLPRELPVKPLKGQMVALASCPLGHPVLADHTYLVPRREMTLVGSTSDDTGFDISTDGRAILSLAALAGQICPALASARVAESWAGLRPMTPDRMPIIGHDPDAPALIYACGHSRNGILLAPATALAVADLLAGATPRYDLGPFAVERFGRAAADRAGRGHAGRGQPPTQKGDGA